ncbi:AIPR family protein [Ruegeria marisrubri]|uniref:AIPR family protein n=1 Tax=Ruegeria marisrubri TaxID=1685379 RepID=UPI001CD296DB|nr:AIPR family protein [Ruegeria marisrubri]MCA0906058.1 AIPR family protein [Ruegeria marisrubri]
MAKNDVFLLDGLLDQYPVEEYGTLDRGEKFEIFCLEQILKSFDLNPDEVKQGHLDGGLDGGIDGGFIFVNGNLVSRDGPTNWPKTDIRLDVYLINCKHHETFKEATLNTLVATTQELFDMSVSDENLCGKYNDDVLNFRKKFMSVYKRVAIHRPILNFRTIYASRGDVETIGESVQARADQIDRIIGDLFSDATSEFEFFGASELVARHREVKAFDLELPFTDQASGENGGYILFSRLSDYFEFITDDLGQLRRYLLDSNIRDYLGENKVNSDIKTTLQDCDGGDFWWLNNGVTILTTSATIAGRSIVMKNIQIINGLQTSETIYNHFSSGSVTSRDKSLAVKVIVSDEKKLRDQIIVASNNQSLVEQSAFRATDVVQRNIEDALERENWYYERRKNYYRNVGRPSERIVDPMYLARAYTAVVLKNPNSAARLRTRFMRSDQNYTKIFSADHPLQLWPRLVELQKASEEVLIAERKKSHPVVGERFLKNWRGLTALLAVAKRTGSFYFSQADVLRLSVDDDLKGDLELAWTEIKRGREAGKHPNKDDMHKICREFGQRYSLDGWEITGRQSPTRDRTYKVAQKYTEQVTEELLEQVNSLLPQQPWPVGTHRDIAEKLECKPGLVSAAIQELIASGKWKQQQDGEVLDS